MLSKSMEVDNPNFLTVNKKDDVYTLIACHFYKNKNAMMHVERQLTSEELVDLLLKVPVKLNSELPKND